MTNKPNEVSLDISVNIEEDAIQKITELNEKLNDLLRTAVKLNDFSVPIIVEPEQEEEENE